MANDDPGMLLVQVLAPATGRRAQVRVPGDVPLRELAQLLGAEVGVDEVAEITAEGASLDPDTRLATVGVTELTLLRWATPNSAWANDERPSPPMEGDEPPIVPPLDTRPGHRRRHIMLVASAIVVLAAVGGILTAVAVGGSAAPSDVAALGWLESRINSTMFLPYGDDTNSLGGYSSSFSPPVDGVATLDLLPAYTVRLTPTGSAVHHGVGCFTYRLTTPTYPALSATACVRGRKPVTVEPAIGPLPQQRGEDLPLHAFVAGTSATGPYPDAIGRWVQTTPRTWARGASTGHPEFVYQVGRTAAGTIWAVDFPLTLRTTDPTDQRRAAAAEAELRQPAGQVDNNPLGGHSPFGDSLLIEEDGHITFSTEYEVLVRNDSVVGSAPLGSRLG